MFGIFCGLELLFSLAKPICSDSTWEKNLPSFCFVMPTPQQWISKKIRYFSFVQWFHVRGAVSIYINPRCPCFSSCSYSTCTVPSESMLQMSCLTSCLKKMRLYQFSIGNGRSLDVWEDFFQYRGHYEVVLWALRMVTSQTLREEIVVFFTPSIWL
jgi:hypothetical protein